MGALTDLIKQAVTLVGIMLILSVVLYLVQEFGG